MTPEQRKSYVRAIQPVWSRVRRDVHAIKVERGSRWLREPLTLHTLETHVSGGQARGARAIKAGESTTMLAVFDMDSHDGATSWNDMMLAAYQVVDAAAAAGYEVIPWRSSGGRGVHLYVLWDQPQDAYSVRQAMYGCLAAAGFKSGALGVAEGEIEVFPKQDEIGAEDFGSQTILPLAGKSVPLDMLLGVAGTREDALTLAWPVSSPVPVLERPQRSELATLESVEPIERVRKALFAIPNDGIDADCPDYDEWFKLCCAVHEATGGSPEGEELFLEWSSQNPIHDQKFFEDRVWDYVKPADARTNAITRGTLYAQAIAAGWNKAGPDGFEDVVFDHTMPAQMPTAAGAAGLSDVTSPTAGVDGRDLPGFKRKKDGGILSIIPNLLMVCRRSDLCGWHIRFDEFSDEVMLSVDGEQWRGFADADYTRLRDHLERNDFDPIAKETMRDVVHLVAQENKFDSAVEWLTTLPPWDGIERVRHFLHRYAGTADGQYEAAVSAYWWTAHVGRVLDPGCQADMAPILVGPQGSGKTSLVNAIAPAPEFAVELTFDDHDDDQARKLRRKLVAELGELQGLRKREQEQVKAFITRRCENWIPKFKEFGTSYLRRAVFAGTTNQDQFLVDETGNRRWLPVVVTNCDPAAVERDRNQLWAEATLMFKDGGIRWRDAERLAQLEHSKFKVPDVWEERFAAWLQSPDIDGTRISQRPHITMSMALVECMAIDASRTNRGDQMRAAAALKSLGYEVTLKRVNGKPQRVYVLP